MATPNESLKFELLQADDYSQYLLSNPREIRQILRGLIEKRAMVTAYLDGPGESFLTTPLDLTPDERGLILDASNDETMNQHALASQQVFCITQLDNVKIQFALSDLERQAYPARFALRAPVPDLLLRLQRREYYRLAAPAAHSLTCTVPIQGPGGVTSYQARIVDISGGGIAVMVPPKGVLIEPEMAFQDCHIMLPEVGPVDATLMIRNVFRLTNRQGITMLRAGCQFIDLPDNMNTLINRYILKVERGRSGRLR